MRELARRRGARRRRESNAGGRSTYPYHGDAMATLPELDPSQVAELGARLRENIARAVKAPEQVLRDVLVALLAEGHVLIEDYPGVGKTALARALARSIDAEYARVQCTADLLPADVVGTNVYNQRENRFEFRPGPVFANVVLVDEVNRASPKTQSGLLECMQERHVTVDKHTHELARPVPGGGHPEPGRVRGHLPAARGPARPLHGARLARLPDAPTRRPRCSPTTPSATACSTSSPWPRWARCSPRRSPSGAVHGSEALRRYVVGILDATRADPRVDLGASPARRADALPRRQGDRRARRARPRPARRRPGARELGAHPPPAARARLGRATSARPWCATPWTASRLC